MECEIFSILPTGELVCTNQKDWARVGDVYNPPSDLTEDQISQIESWIKVSEVAHRVGNIFSVTSYGDDYVDVETRFRVPAMARNVSKELDAKLQDLFNDIKQSGWRTALDWARVDSEGVDPIIIRRLAVLANPKQDDLFGLELVLTRVAEVVESTRIGDHLMDPREQWWIERKTF